MPKLEFLPSIRESETVTCQRCHTRQYPNHACAKCRRPLEVGYVNIRIDTLLNPDLALSKEHVAQVIGTLLRSLRKRRGISQSQLAIRARGHITRTSMSKSECGHMLLPIHKLLPLAKALGLTAVILRFDGAANNAVHRSTNRH